MRVPLYIIGYTISTVSYIVLFTHLIPRGIHVPDERSKYPVYCEDHCYQYYGQKSERDLRCESNCKLCVEYRGLVWFVGALLRIIPVYFVLLILPDTVVWLAIHYVEWFKRFHLRIVASDMYFKQQEKKEKIRKKRFREKMERYERRAQERQDAEIDVIYKNLLQKEKL